MALRAHQEARHAQAQQMRACALRGTAALADLLPGQNGVVRFPPKRYAHERASVDRLAKVRHGHVDRPVAVARREHHLEARACGGASATKPAEGGHTRVLEREAREKQRLCCSVGLPIAGACLAA